MTTSRYLESIWKRVQNGKVVGGHNPAFSPFQPSSIPLRPLSSPTPSMQSWVNSQPLTPPHVPNSSTIIVLCTSLLDYTFCLTLVTEVLPSRPKLQILPLPLLATNGGQLTSPLSQAVSSSAKQQQLHDFTRLWQSHETPMENSGIRKILSKGWFFFLT